MWCSVCDAERPNGHDLRAEVEALPDCRHCGEKIIEHEWGWEHYLTGCTTCSLTAEPASHASHQ